jgi:hypothetical protein
MAERTSSNPSRSEDAGHKAASLAGDNGLTHTLGGRGQVPAINPYPAVWRGYRKNEKGGFDQ